MISTRENLLSRFIDTDSLLLVLVAAFIWLAAFAGIRPLMLPDEGRYVGVAWEMVSSGNWRVPHIDGMPFFHKPPLFYWLSTLSLNIFGVHEWAARIVSIFAGVITVAGLYLFVRHYRNSQWATMAAVVLATQPYFFAGSQFANLDMLVASLISLTILSGADAVFRLESDRPHRSALARTYALAAFGVLAKGLIGIVLPGGVLFFWLVWRSSWRLSRALLWPTGGLLFLLIALPWFLSMQQAYPGFFDYFVIYHHFQRFTGSNFNNQEPFWFYVPVLILFALPWTPWLGRFVNRTYWKNEASDSLRSLMVIWFLVILVFFSLPSSKLVGYVLPALPPMAYFIAQVLARWLERDPTKARRGYLATLAVAATLCIAVIVGIVVSDKVSAKALATTSRLTFKPDDQVVMVSGYQYDLPFYLRSTKPAWVVLDWSDPKIANSDHWEKELLDAGKFDPSTAHSVLINAPQFTERLCTYRQPEALWIWGSPNPPPTLPWLSALPATVTDGKHAFWRLTRDTIRALPVCAEKPTVG